MRLLLLLSLLVVNSISSITVNVLVVLSSNDGNTTLVSSSIAVEQINYNNVKYQVQLYNITESPGNFEFR